VLTLFSSPTPKNNTRGAGMKLTKQEQQLINLVGNIILEGLIDGAEEDHIEIKVSDKRIKELRELLNGRVTKRG
jgi:hypothetical protein